MAKIADDVFTLLEDMASNNYQWPSEWSISKKAAGLFEVDQLTTLSAQILDLSNQFTAFTTHEAHQKKLQLWPILHIQ